MSQETVAQILSIEQSAVQLCEDARRQAAESAAEAEKAASQLREQTLAHVRQQAERIAAEGREAVEMERARVIAQAEAEAQRLEAQAAQRFDQAVGFVLDQVAGRK